MVSNEQVSQANAGIANLPKGVVAVFIGATSGIGQQTLKHFAQYAPSPRIYSVARSSAAVSHTSFLDSLPSSNESPPTIITADISLVAEVAKVVEAIRAKETKVDLLFMSPGFLAFEGRNLTTEDLEPSMTTRYYSRLRAVQLLLPLLNKATMPGGPRVISVLAGGLERALNEEDLGLDIPGNWSVWESSFHSATMGTLCLELLASQNPLLSVVHWNPGPVATRGLATAQKNGVNPPNIMEEDESGAIGAYLATNGRYSVNPGAVLPSPEGLDAVAKTGGGIFIVDPRGESIENETVLSEMRQRGVPEVVWKFTQDVFASC